MSGWVACAAVIGGRVTKAGWIKKRSMYPHDVVATMVFLHSLTKFENRAQDIEDAPE